MIVLIGNLFSLIGCTLMVLSGLIKEKKNILTVQCVQFTFMGLANMTLGAFSGLIANIVSLTRNVVFTHRDTSLSLKILFIVLQVILSIKQNMAWVDWLPVIACVTFTWIIDTPSEITLKKVTLFCLICWVIYDFSYLNYVGFSFDLFSIISNIIGILMIKKDKKVAAQ